MKQKPYLFLLALFIFSCSKSKLISELSNTKNFTSFSFNFSKNQNLALDIYCEIRGDSIIATTFAGTEINNLKPTFTFNGKEAVVDNQKQISGETSQNFSTIKTYTLVAEDGSTKAFYVKFEDTKLPVLHINTNNKPIISKETYINGSLIIKENLVGNSIYEGDIEIRGRGNSTWGLPKKPYKIKLNKKAGLLGMNEARQWVLLANHADKTLIRNEVGFEISRILGIPFTPSSKMVDVILNGVYVGNYELVEQIEVSKTKVNLSDISQQESNLSNGFLIEVDGFATAEKVNFRSTINVPISVHYPDDEVITAIQKQDIVGFIAGFENKLFSVDFDDPENGYRKYFDVDSYINFYLANEIIGNPDLFWSTYMYKKQNENILFSGPVWDMDIAFNNDFRLGDTQNKLMVNVGFEPKHWINRLMQDKNFRKKIRDRWNVIKNNKLLGIENYIDKMAKQIGSSQKKNFLRWPILNEKIYNNLQAAGSFEAEVAFMKNYLVKRINWLDSQFNGPVFD